MHRYRLVPSPPLLQQVVPHITDAIQDWVERVAHTPVDGRDGVPDVCVGARRAGGCAAARSARSHTRTCCTRILPHIGGSLPCMPPNSPMGMPCPRPTPWLLQLRD